MQWPTSRGRSNEAGFARVLICELIVYALVVVALPMRAAAAGPRGFFVLNDDNPARTHPYNGPVPMPQMFFADTLLSGVSLREGWADIEPQDGQFDWSYFDSQIARAQGNGKKVILRVFTNAGGLETPPWLYRAGAQPFLTNAPSRGSVSVPVPWDSIFQAKWTELIRAFGQKYDHNPAVVLIQMDSADWTGGEMHLPKGPADRQHWMQIGYSSAKLVGAWQRVIDAYNQAFPDKPLALDVQLPVFNDSTVERVVSYMKRTLDGRCAVQHNALAAKTVEQSWPQSWVVGARGSCIIGFQELTPATPVRWNNYGARFGGDFTTALEKAARAGMQYMEIYPPDVHNPAFRPIIQKYQNMMTSNFVASAVRRGPNGYRSKM